MRNLGSKLFVLVVAAIVVGGLGYAFLPQPVEVDLVEVERGTVRVTVDEDGKTRIREKYVVSAPLNGRILRISMDPGDEVEAGKTLLTMIEPRDPELLDARSVAQAEARVKAAEATLRQVEPELEAARAGQAFAEAEVTRMRKAFEGKGVSQSEVESAEMLNRQRSEELRSAKVSEEIARFELEQAKAALTAFAAAAGRHWRQGAGQHDRESAEARSERGALGKRKYAREQRCDRGQAQEWSRLELSDLLADRRPRAARVAGKRRRRDARHAAGGAGRSGDDLEVEIDVLSRDAVKIHPGDVVLLEHWGGEAPLRGRVRVVEPSGFTKISTLGVEEQRV